MTPPPVPVERNRAGRPNSSANQSMTRVSTSVAAGLVAQSMPCTPSPDESRSPRMAGPDTFAGKYAKNDGCCQWVMPGITISSMSASRAKMSSPPAGGSSGSPAAMSPGCTRERTGIVSTRSW